MDKARGRVDWKREKGEGKMEERKRSEGGGCAWDESVRKERGNDEGEGSE